MRFAGSRWAGITEGASMNAITIHQSDREWSKALQSLVARTRRRFRDLAANMRAKLKGGNPEFSWAESTEEMIASWEPTIGASRCQVIRESLFSAFVENPETWFGRFDVLPNDLRELVYEAVFFYALEQLARNRGRADNVRYVTNVLVWLTYIFERSTVREDLAHFWARHANRKDPKPC